MAVGLLDGSTGELRTVLFDNIGEVRKGLHFVQNWPIGRRELQNRHNNGGFVAAQTNRLEQGRGLGGVGGVGHDVS
jgi:hypothetical protein